MPLAACTTLRPAAALALLAGLGFSTASQATLGIFEHGAGIKSMGMGGAAYSVAMESTALAANPAHAISLGNRLDLGVDTFMALASARYVGNTGPSGNDPAYERFRTDAKRYYYIPQGGYTQKLGERWALGITLLSAGLGPDYPESPYARFGGAHRSSLQVGSTSLISALAYKLSDTQVLGVSLNTGYQVLAVQGLQFLANPQVSESPRHVTDQGKDGSFTIGYSLGYQAQLTPWLAAGLGYRSKNWTQKHDEYAGLVGDGGKLELPAIYGGGFTLTPSPAWTVSLEAQKFAYRGRKAFRNGLSKLNEGKPLGSPDGPGFGLDDQNAYKFGIAYQATPKLVLRAGYVHATQMVNPSETLFGFLGCLVITDQYTAGASYQFRTWELSGYLVNAPVDGVNGKNSIPPTFGGGEARVTDEVFGVGLSLGRRFGL